jgi:hypothetical protein
MDRNMKISKPLQISLALHSFLVMYLSRGIRVLVAFPCTYMACLVRLSSRFGENTPT